MTLFDIMAVLLGLSAAFGFVNHRFIGLPHTIGLVVMAMTASIAVIVVDLIVPANALTVDTKPCISAAPCAQRCAPSTFKTR